MALNIRKIRNAAVIGSGAFGTALATVLSKKSDTVKVWHINADEAKKINEQRENIYFLKGIKLPSNIQYSADATECVRGADIVVFVTPTQFFRGFLEKHAEVLRREVLCRGIPVVLCSKGIERSSLMFSSDIFDSVLPGYPASVLAGPSFAAEIARGKVTHVAVANRDISKAREVQSILSTADGSFRCWATTDTVGCEVAGAVKNVLAIYSGLAFGLGAELNARAAVIARGLLEIRELTISLGGTGEAVFGLAGLGDLLLTCSSELSRNFTVGLRLGKGETMEHIRRTSKAVAEGVATAEPLERLAKKQKLSLPMCHKVYEMIYENKDPRESFNAAFSSGDRDEGLPPLVKPSKL